MILPSNNLILKNIKDNFYYNGIEVSKENFDITEFAPICNKINEFKDGLRQENFLKDFQKTHSVIAKVRLTKNIVLLCNYQKDEIYFGLYDKNISKIIPLNKDIFNLLVKEDTLHLSYELNKTAKMIDKGIIKETKEKDISMLLSFKNYIDIINKSEQSFQYTYELEFTNGNKELILTDEELKQSIKEL